MAAGAALGRFEGLNNEPDMEAPYAYTFAGRHDRTCEVVRAGLGLFADTPGGLVGNDDSGGISSWYVWNAGGLFPLAGQDLFVLGCPLFPAARLHLANGNTMSITASNSGRGTPYVASVSLNRTPLTEPFLKWEQMSTGGHLHFEMSPQPTGWAASAPGT